MATQNVQLALPPYNSATWNSPLNGNFSIIDAVFGNTKTISVTAADYALTIADLQNLRINIAGNNGGSDITVRFPGGVGGSWIVTNNAFTSGGKVYLATSSTSVPGIPIPATGSLFVFSDGANLYSAVSGSQGNYLPLSGGTITGDLAVNGKISTGNTLALFPGGVTVGGTTTVKDLLITGQFDLSTTNIRAASLTAGGGVLVGSDKLAVTGSSTFNGDATVNGSLRVPLGSLSITNSLANNTLSGATTIPSSSSLTIKTGSTFTVESGVNVAINGAFQPASISTGDITSSTKIVCTGPGGIDAGSGGFKTTGTIASGTQTITGDCTASGKIVATGELSAKANLVVGGTSSFTGSASFSSTGSFTGELTCAKRITTTADIFVNASSGLSNIFMAPQDKGVLGSVSLSAAPNFVVIGFFNSYASNVNAYLNMQNGKWTASGGVAVPAPTLSSGVSNLPGVTYEENGKTLVDIGSVLSHLVGEIAQLKSELSALKKL